MTRESESNADKSFVRTNTNSRIRITQDNWDPDLQHAAAKRHAVEEKAIISIMMKRMNVRIVVMSEPELLLVTSLL